LCVWDEVGCEECCKLEASIGVLMLFAEVTGELPLRRLLEGFSTSNVARSKAEAEALGTASILDMAA
jgi:hypothetical protein